MSDQYPAEDDATDRGIVIEVTLEESDRRATTTSRADQRARHRSDGAHRCRPRGVEPNFRTVDPAQPVVVVGIGFYSILTATVAATFVHQDDKGEEERAEIRAEIREMRSQLARIEQALGERGP
jgi:hypothetical protein